MINIFLSDCEIFLCSQDNLPTEEEYTESKSQEEDSEEEGANLVPRILYDNSAESEQGGRALMTN